MKILVLGIFYANKGAMLMLEAIHDQLRERFPDVELLVPDSMPRAVRRELGLGAVLLRDGHLLDPRRWRQWVPTWLRKMNSLNSVDVILDASGFGYGDYWGRDKLTRRLVRTLRRKRANQPAILLPQALGPFEAPGMASAFSEAVEYLDLLYVRDARSMEHVEAVVGSPPNVRRAPDFTNLLHPQLPKRLDYLRGARLLIPNQKMVVGQPIENEERYLRFLTDTIETLRKDGPPVTILLHEGLKDQALVEKLNERIEGPCSVVDEPSPLVTKAIIGAADLVVSSRFHGLVSALSSGVPALACGWSHKYRELLSDYDAPRHVVDVSDESGWQTHLSAFLRDANDPEFRSKLDAAARRERTKSEEMWHEVTQLLQRKVRR